MSALYPVPVIKRAALALAGLSLALTIALVVSPTVRASMAAFLREIGGVIFNETSDYPGGTEEMTLAPEQTLSLESARDSLPFAFGIPTWMPEGYVMEPTVRITQFDEAFTPVSISFKKSTAQGWDETIELMVGQNGSSWVIAPDSAELVSIHGQDAALIRGGWNHETRRWEAGLGGLTLAWTKGDVLYQLLTSARVTADDLIRIAESIP